MSARPLPLGEATRRLLEAVRKLPNPPMYLGQAAQEAELSLAAAQRKWAAARKARRAG